MTFAKVKDIEGTSFVYLWQPSSDEYSGYDLQVYTLENYPKFLRQLKMTHCKNGTDLHFILSYSLVDNCEG